MKLLLKIAVGVLLGFVGLVAGAFLGARLAPEDGLAGGATVFLFGIGGLLVALVVAVLLARRY